MYNKTISALLAGGLLVGCAEPDPVPNPNQAPVSQITKAGDFLQVASTDDQDSSSQLSYVWFVNGVQVSESTYFDISELENGTVVLLQTTDSQGESDTEVFTITDSSVVQNQPPESIITKSGDLLQAASTDDQDRQSEMSFTWFVDGVETSNENYLDISAMVNDTVITLETTDTDGESHSVTHTITGSTVTLNDAPVSIITKQSSVLLQVGSTDDHDLISEMTYVWSVNGVPTSEETSLDISQMVDGTIITLETTDSDDASHSVTHTITGSTYDPNRDPIADIQTISDITSGDAPLSITFDSSGSFDPDTSDTLTYLWTFGDGSESNLANPTHVFSDADNYQVTLTVTDNHGASDSVNLNITATSPSEDLNPVASFTMEPSSGDAPLSVSFDAMGSTDDKGAVTYSWNFGDLSAENTTVDPTHVFTAVGEYTVRLTVKDNADQTHFIEQTVSVLEANVAPVADIQTDTISGDVPLTVAFDASGSTDPNASDTLTYFWDFGDGVGTSVLAMPSYEFDSADNYQVTLTVTDNHGVQNVKTINISATNPLVDLDPVASFTMDPSSGDAPLSVNFDAMDSMDDKGPVTYSWDFGDMSAEDTTVDPSHVFTAVGDYTVRLTVKDNADRTHFVEHIVSVLEANVAPIADIQTDFTTGDAPLAVEFNGSGSTDSNSADTITYSWDFGDGSAPSTLENPTHTFVNHGMYTVVLTVSDGSLMDTQSVVITADEVVVPNTAPVAGFIISSNGLEVTVNASTTTDETDDFADLDFAWDFNGEGSDTGSIATYTFATEGAKSITLTVTDPSDASHFVTHSVTVSIPQVANEDYTQLYEEGVTTVSEITNCGVNPASVSNSVSVLDSTFNLAGSWNHITSANISGEFAGLAKQASAYDIASSINGTATGCENESTLDSLLVKKYGDWDHQHSNGFTLTVPNSQTFSDLETLVLDVYIDSNDSIIPDVTEVTNAYGSLMSTAEIAEFADGNIHFDVNLKSDGAFAASADIEISINDLDTWLRIEIPVQNMSFWEEVNYARVAKTWAEMQSRNVNTVHFVAETANRLVYRNYDPDNFDVNTAPKLYIEQMLKIRKVEILTPTSSQDAYPVADFTVDAPSGDAPHAVVFNAGNSSDDMGSIDYAWDFGDSSASSDIFNPTHTYQAPGIYTVSLTVTDSANQSSVMTQEITVTQSTVNVAPVADFTMSTQAGPAVLSVTFDGSVSTDANNDNLSYSWNFGDSNDTTGSTLAMPTHSFSVDGSYDVTLTVDDGEYTDTKTMTVTVDSDIPVNQLPTASFEVTNVDLKVNVDAMLSSDPEMLDLTYAWEFINESNMVVGYQANVTSVFNFATAGTKSVRLTVTDSEGQIDTLTKSITVTEPEGGGLGDGTILINEDFESFANNSQPDGWDIYAEYQTNPTYNPSLYTSNINVVNTDAVSGSQSLRIVGKQNGPMQIVKQLEGTHNKIYTRVYIKQSLQLGGLSGTNHDHIIALRSTTNSANEEVRWGESKGAIGTVLVNNSPNIDDGAPDPASPNFGEHVVSADEWHCIEVGFDDTGDVSKVFSWSDGVLVHSIEQNSDFTNIKDSVADHWMSHMFHEIVFGWHSFSSNTNTLYFDDLVVSTDRVGCDGTPASEITLMPQFSATQDAMTVSVDASLSTGSAAFSYAWDFDGEATDTGMIADYTFTSAGEKTITLTVTSGSTVETFSQSVVIVDATYNDLLTRVATNIVAPTCFECHEVSDNKPLMFASTSTVDVEAGMSNYISENTAQQLIDTPNGIGHPANVGDKITDSLNEQDWFDLVTAIAANTGGSLGNGNILIVDDFEDTAVGSLSSSWRTWLAHGAVDGVNSASEGQYAVVDDSMSYRGQNSLHIKTGQEAAPTFIFQEIDKSSNPEALYIRAFMYLPVAVGGGVEGGFSEHVHFSSTFESITSLNNQTGEYELNLDDTNKDIRYGTWKGQIIGGFQAKNSDSSTNIHTTDTIQANEWTCVEWAVIKDPTFDQMYGWINDSEVFAATDSTHWSNGATTGFFDDSTDFVSFGWRAFNLTMGVTDIWFDDIAVSDERIGCN